ncbi:MAG: FCD domain-containing protein [Burkholderiaceae bacterium]|nr:FCD domain-containing protein [Burkholderiaceae bacterium]
MTIRMGAFGYAPACAGTPQLLKRSLDQHEAIFSALQAGESGRAEESMRRHIRDSLASMDELPDEHF